MSSGVFRCKESSNRIKLSKLVQDLLNFGDFSSPQLWGMGVVGGAPTCMLPQTHVCMHTHAHACMVNMIISCKWLPPIGTNPGNSLWCHMHMHACMCVCVCMCMGDTLSPPHIPIHPPPSPRGTPGISENAIALELIKIFQFCLKIWNLWRLPYPCMGV